MKPRVHKAHGFTLIEVIIVIGIAAVVMGFAVPSMRSYMENRYASSQAEVLAAELRKAQIEAISRNVTVEVVMAITPVPAAPTAYNPSTASLSVGGLTTTSPRVNLMNRVAAGITRADMLSSVATGDDMNTAAGDTRARISGPAGVGFSAFGKAQYTLAVGGAKTNVSDNIVYQIVNPFYTGADARRRCVYVTPGGAVKVCDPAAPSGVGASCRPALTAAVCP